MTYIKQKRLTRPEFGIIFREFLKKEIVDDIFRKYSQEYIFQQQIDKINLLEAELKIKDAELQEKDTELQLKDTQIRDQKSIIKTLEEEKDMLRELLEKQV